VQLSRIRGARRAGAVVTALAVGVLGAATLPAPADATAPSADGTVASLAGAVPTWAHGTPLSVLGSGSSVDFVVQLAPRDQAGLKTFVRQVNDPTSSLYHHYLTAQQYAATYGPTAASLSTVTTALEAAGLTIDTVTDQGSYLAVHGSASKVGQLFGTTFGTFGVGGLTLRAPLSTPTIPTALRGLVSNVAGLAQSAPLTPDHAVDTPDASPVFLNARPCSDYYGQKTGGAEVPTYEGQAQKYAVCGYTGQQLRSAYGLKDTGLTGKGVSIGIVDAYASATIEADANQYATNHGEKAFADGQFVENIPVGVQQIPEDPIGLIDPDGWAGEETLDVEAAHSMAPDATIVYQSGLTPYGPTLYVAIGALVEQGKVQIISDSFGSASDDPLPTDKALLDQITDEAAATGVTIAFSSGDDGDETDPSATGERTADYPATSPGVVAVGGTTLKVDAAGQRVDETYWGTKKFLETSDGKGWDQSTYVYGGAGGGGVSTTYAEPDWQKGVVPTDLATYGGVSAGRVVPDLSLLGDPTTGFLMGQTQAFPDGSTKYSEYRIGGTSLACPLFAGMLALAVEKNGDKGLGLVTPTLYAASATSSGIASLFHDPSDVTLDANKQSPFANIRPDYTDGSDATSPVVYSLRTLGNLATLHAYKGYDDSTGLGSPKAAALVAVLNKLPIPTDPTGPSAPGTPGTPTSPGATGAATYHLQLGTAKARRHGAKVRATVVVANTETATAPASQLTVRLGRKVAHVSVPALAGHTEQSFKAVLHGTGPARTLVVKLDGQKVKAKVTQ
jgi:subtilase family serine protease